MESKYIRRQRETIDAEASIGDFDSLLIMFFVLGLGIVLGWLFFDVNDLSQETLDDICFNLSGNETATGSINRDGKLVCEIPSFDSTQNIIIRENSENG